MSLHHSHIATSISIIRAVNTKLPLAIQLKTFFAKQKKYGSKDRKQIATLCYNYYRIGNFYNSPLHEQQIIDAAFLCSTSTTKFLEVVNPNYNEVVTSPLHQKMVYIGLKNGIIFLHKNLLSTCIDKGDFEQFFITQPFTFLRIRLGFTNQVLQKLTNAQINYAALPNQAVALVQGQKIDTILQLNTEAVIQDHSSQQVFNFLKTKTYFPTNKNLTVWDCCAASGGKSILLTDVLQNKITITATDVRANMLLNLKARFRAAGIKKYTSFAADLAKPHVFLNSTAFDIIICDVPCTGSGTWARTPEQQYFYEPNSLANLVVLQKTIASNALPFLQINGLFFYITCSAFAAENEDVVQHLQQKFHLQLLQMEYIKGYKNNADTMFVAVLLKTAN